MDTQHGMLLPMSQPRERSLTAAALADLEHHEIVDGELVQKASPSFEHGDIQGTIFGRLLGFRGRGTPGGWWFSQEVEVELGTRQVYRPDIAGWRIARVPERPSGSPLRIAPDWVCEVLSPSTTARDLGTKLQAYHRAHVGHYWVAHPIEHLLHVYRWHETGYLLVLSATPGDVVRVEPFDVIDLDIRDIFGLPPREP